MAPDVSGPALRETYAADVEAILSHRHDQGADWWTTPDRRLLKGSPFNTLECINYLLDLGVSPSDMELAGAIDLVLRAWQDDGRFRLYPTGAVLPCQTAFAARTLCRAGYADDPRLRVTLAHLAGSQWQDAGWRCNKFSYGRGPETLHANPHPTLQALDAFRLSGRADDGPALDAAVGLLLEHWRIREPIGPCHYGIGTRFLQVEYPFRSYNLFYWVYVLSFYDTAQQDPRFLEAFSLLTSKLVAGQIIVERVVPKLAGLAFCRKAQPSALATRRYQEVLDNLAASG